MMLMPEKRGKTRLTSPCGPTVKVKSRPTCNLISWLTDMGDSASRKMKDNRGGSGSMCLIVGTGVSKV